MPRGPATGPSAGPRLPSAAGCFTPRPFSTPSSSRPRAPLTALPANNNNSATRASSSASASGTARPSTTTLASKSSEVIVSAHFTAPRVSTSTAAPLVPSKRPSPTAARVDKGKGRAVEQEEEEEVDELASDDDEAGDENLPPSAQLQHPQPHAAKKARVSLDSGYYEGGAGAGGAHPPAGVGGADAEMDVEVPESEHGGEGGDMLLEEAVGLGLATGGGLGAAPRQPQPQPRAGPTHALTSSGQTGSSAEFDVRRAFSVAPCRPRSRVSLHAEQDIDALERKLLMLTERRAAVMEEFVEIATNGLGVTAAGREEGELRVSLCVPILNRSRTSATTLTDALFGSSRSYVEERLPEARARLKALGVAPSLLQLETERRANTLEELAEVIVTGERSHADNDEEYLRHNLCVASRLARVRDASLGSRPDLRERATATACSTTRASRSSKPRATSRPHAPSRAAPPALLPPPASRPSSPAASSPRPRTRSPADTPPRARPSRPLSRRGLARLSSSSSSSTRRAR